MKEVPAVVEPLILEEPNVVGQGTGAIDPEEDDNVDPNEADEVIAPRRSGRIRN